LTILSDYVARMVAAGMDPSEAMQIVAEVFAAGAANVPARSANAVRQQRYRDNKKRNETVTNRNAVTPDVEDSGRNETVTNRNETVTRYGASLSNTKTDIESKKDKRGTRLSPDWRPSDADRGYARSLGWSDSQVDAEAENFRDYWVAKAGKDAAKADWPRTWARWIRNSKTKPGAPAKPLTAHQQERETGREILNALRDASGRTNSGLQRHDPGDGSAGLRGGVRGALINLSAARDRAGHEPIERPSGDGQLPQFGKVSGAS